MSAVGAYLRQLREQRGLSVEEVARATRVACRYLEALEAENFAELPAPVFTRGFVRAYCQVLGVPPDEALTRFEEGIAATSPSAGETGPGAGRRPPARGVESLRSTRPAGAAEAERRGSGAVLVSFVLLVVLGSALFAVTLVLNAARDDGADRRPVVTAPETSVADPARIDPPPPAPETLAAPPVTPVPPALAPLPLPRPPTPAAEPPRTLLAPPTGAPAAAAVSLPYRLIARTTETTWVRVRTEDGRSSEETIPAGETREWVSNRPFVLTIGNAGGISLELNGQPLPALGGSGAVISRLVVPAEPR